MKDTNQCADRLTQTSAEQKVNSLEKKKNFTQNKSMGNKNLRSPLIACVKDGRNPQVQHHGNELATFAKAILVDKICRKNAIFLRRTEVTSHKASLLTKIGLVNFGQTEANNSRFFWSFDLTKIQVPGNVKTMANNVGSRKENSSSHSDFLVDVFSRRTKTRVHAYCLVRSLTGLVL